MSDASNNNTLRDAIGTGALFGAPWLLNKGVALARAAAPYIAKGGSIGLRFGKGLGIGALPALFGSGANPSEPDIAAQLKNAYAGGINRPPGGIFGTGAGYGVSPNPVAPPAPAAPPAVTTPPPGLDLSPASLARHQPWMFPPQAAPAATAPVPLPPPRPPMPAAMASQAPQPQPQWNNNDIMSAIYQGVPQQQSPFHVTQGPSVIDKFMSALLGSPASHDQQASGYQS